MLHKTLINIKDPRYFQIAFLSFFLISGLLLQFLNDIRTIDIALYISTALLVQFLCDYFSKQPWNWKSALITSLSLSLLLRMPSLSLVSLAAALAIGSKFIFRVKGQHLFNPANIAIVCSVLLLGGWISPGQWGHSALLVFIFIGLGVLVSIKAARIDVALIFLCSFSILLIGRALYLGDPLTIPLHQLQNGALFLFAFFMITDPKTSPNHRIARVLYAVLLAIVSYVLQFYWFVPQGMLYALVLICLLVPLLNHWFPEQSYQWAGVNINKQLNQKVCA